MSMLTGNNISVKEYDKDLEIEIEKKKCHLKATTVAVIVGSLGMI